MRRALSRRIWIQAVLVAFLVTLAVQVVHTLAFDRDDFAGPSDGHAALEISCDAAHCDIPHHHHVPLSPGHDHRTCSICHSTVVAPLKPAATFTVASSFSAPALLTFEAAVRSLPHLAKSGPRGPPVA